MEITFLESAIHQFHIAMQRRCQAKHNGAFHLGSNNIWIDGDATVKHTGYLVHLNYTVGNGDLGNLRHICQKRAVCGKTQVVTRWRLHLAHLLTGNLDDIVESRIGRAVLQTEVHHIHTRCQSQLVHHGFFREGRKRMSNRAPECQRHAVIDSDVMNAAMRKIVVFSQAFNAGRIHYPTLEGAFRQPHHKIDWRTGQTWKQPRQHVF